MRTPAWARRTLAGARSPVRDSSLPAMLSWVTSTARPPSSVGDGHADRTADGVEHDDVAVGGQRGRAPADVGDVDDDGAVVDLVLADAGRPPVHCTTADPSGGAVGAEADVDAEPGDLGAEPRRRAARSARPRRPARRARPPARRARPGGPARRRRGRPPARPGRRRRRRRPAGSRAGDVPVGVLGLPAGRRLADARHERVAGVADLARLVAPGARADPLGLPARSLATRSGSAIWARVISTAAHEAGSS